MMMASYMLVQEGNEVRRRECAMSSGIENCHPTLPLHDRFCSANRGGLNNSLTNEDPVQPVQVTILPRRSVLEEFLQEPVMAFTLMPKCFLGKGY